MSYCRVHQVWFELTEDLYTVVVEDGQFVGCPVCLAHGRRVLHLVTGTWQPENAETTAVATAAVS